MPMSMICRPVFVVNSIDTTPNAFTFGDQTNVAVSTQITSLPVTISGLGGGQSAPITVSGGTYSKNGGAFTSSAGTMLNGDVVQARHTSSASNSTATNTVVTIGGVSDTFTSTTEAASGGVSVFTFPIDTGNTAPSRFTLEWSWPRSGVSGSNYRPYKAYPGIPYEIDCMGYGGRPPYKFLLVTGPSGMGFVLDYLPRDYLTNGRQGYGTLRWANPVTSGSPHTVTLRITDQDNTSVDVTFSLTVTTSGFLFVDSVNGHASSANGGGGSSGTGTISNPFLTLNDVFAGATGGTAFATKHDATYQNNHMILRAGTYNLNATYAEDTGVAFDRATWSAEKPSVIYGYPGETATIDFGGRVWNCEGGPIFRGNMNWANLDNGNSEEQCFRYGGSNPNAMFQDIRSSNVVDVGHTSNNCSVFFTVHEAISSYHNMSRCTFGNTNSHDLWLLYVCSKVVIEWCTVTGTLDGGEAHGFYFKDGVAGVCARYNFALNASNSQRLFRVDGYNESQQADNYQFVYNACRTSADAVLVGTNQPTTPVGTIYEDRNTFFGGNPARQLTIGATFNTQQNVIRYTTNPITNTGGATVTTTNNLQATSGLIDTTTLKLTGTDRSSFLGIRGHEIADSSTT